MGERGLFDLSGKVALVTGAGRGLGRVFCQALAESGADVVCTDIVEENVKETAQLLQEFGHQSLAIRADVSKLEDVQHMINETVSQFERLDIAVNNAAIATKPALFHEILPEDWHRCIAVNLTGVFLCMQEELRAMLKQRSGSIINISSVAGLAGYFVDPFPSSVAYVAAKHGVIGLTREAALEYAKHNIRVNAIAPGHHSGTELAKETKAILSPEDWGQRERKLLELIPMGRRATPQELKGLIVYLASDASSYVTGQTFASDGGWLA